MNGTRRALLTSVAALGGVITLASTTGVFAVFTDQATTGTNTFATKDLPRAADLQLAIGSSAGNWSIDCGTYSDDLQTGLISMSNATPNLGADSTFVCLKNAGSATVDVTTSAIDLTDEDTDCTGDEAAVDTTCGVLDGQPVGTPPQAGELSPLITFSLTAADCSDVNQGGRGLGALPDVTDVSVASMAPGEVLCVNFTARYLPTDAEAQAAQSDTATWRFAFDGTVPTT